MNSYICFSSLLILALFSWSSSTPVQAVNYTTLEIFPNQNCGGTPDVIDLFYDQCTAYPWSNEAFTWKNFSALKARTIQCDNGKGVAQIVVRAYADAQCAGPWTTFAEIYVTATPEVPAVINPYICYFISLDIIPMPFLLYIVKFKSYQCDGIVVPIVPTPVPVITSSPTPLPTPTPLPSPTTTPAPTETPTPTIRVCEYTDTACTTTPICYSVASGQCISYSGYALGGRTSGSARYNVTCLGDVTTSIGSGYYVNPTCTYVMNSSSEYQTSDSAGYRLNTCYRVSMGNLNSVMYTMWPCNKVAARPSPDPNPPTAPLPVCVDAEWIEVQGLEKVHATDGVGQLLCLVGLDDIPCGTPDHILEVTVDDNMKLLTYEQVCMVRECVSKRGRFNGVLHSDAEKLPAQQGHKLTTLAQRATVWSRWENRLVHAAQKLGLSYVNRGLTYLQRRNSAKHLVKQG